MSRRAFAALVLGIGAGVLLLFLAGLGVGRYTVPPGEVLRILLGRGSGPDTASAIIL